MQSGNSGQRQTYDAADRPRALPTWSLSLRNRIDKADGMIATTGNVLIALSYYPTYFPDLVRRIETFKSRFDLAMTVVVLNNRAISAHSARSALDPKCRPYQILEHSNEGSEFGGYQAGLDCILRGSDGARDFLIFNDTLGIHYELYDEHLDALQRHICDQQSSKRIVGRVDEADQLLSLGGLTGNRWIRSNLMFIDHDALKSIDDQLYLPEVANWVHDVADPNAFFGDEVGPATKARISRWLFEPGGWYDAAPLSCASRTRLCLKATSILQELYLTMRLEHAGTMIQGLELLEYEKKQVLWKNRGSKILRKFGFDARRKG
jgi:hypothetical protein